jgi:hypothetical protein
MLMSEVVLSDAQLRALGCMTFESRRLERFVDAIIRDLCGFDEDRFAVFLGTWMFDKKVEVLKEILKSRRTGTPLEAEFATVYASIKHLNAQRNTAVHGDWDGVTKAGHRIARRKGRGLSVKATELLKIARGLAKAVEDLSDLCIRSGPPRSGAAPVSNARRVTSKKAPNPAIERTRTGKPVPAARVKPRAS